MKSNIFIKELPIFNFKNYLNNKESDKEYKKINFKNQKISNLIYDKNSKINVEIFISYLISKLSELDMCPSFCKMYLCINTVLFKYTEKIHKDDDLNEMKYYCKKNKNNMKITKSYGRKYLVFKNMPVYLLGYEKADIDLLEYILKNAEEYLPSSFFQILPPINN